MDEAKRRVMEWGGKKRERECDGVGKQNERQGVWRWGGSKRKQE